MEINEVMNHWPHWTWVTASLIVRGKCVWVQNAENTSSAVGLEEGGVVEALSIVLLSSMGAGFV